ncbi:MAG: DUF1073 domain-containing protein, partial [Parafilimonas terrae]|nr:DUF1073 domain-containing protein [Parafilimonas terrae]
ERGALRLHPSRVIRFLGHELPDPALGAEAWSDSVLQVLYDAIHAVALTQAGATALMHEAKVDVVTVPNLSEHLSSAATTAQLSARFGYAAAMKSINNLLLLGDGETWARQKIDFAGLPEMVRTFLQVAAGAADIPVTRLLGQSPAGLSATGDHDTRNYYDMISARQELDLRPQLERLDRYLLRSAGVDGLTFEFRPLWQLSAAERAEVALKKAQATEVYAGLNLWPAFTTARLVEAQLAEDGTYPGAEAVFAEGVAEVRAETGESESGESVAQPVRDYPGQPRDPLGQFAEGKQSGEGNGVAPDGTSIDPVAHFWEHKRLEKRRRRHQKELERERRLEEQHGISKPGDAPGSSEQPLPGNLKRASMHQLEQAARKAGYDSVETWKTGALQLNSRSDIVIDKEGKAYAIPRTGPGDPQPLNIEKLK